MSYDISCLEPKAVWKYFDRIRQIPRCSGHESAIAEAVIDWSAANGASGTRDAAGNVIVRIPATRGYETVPGLVLQCHLDMVCEKDSRKVFDFATDPISLVRDGDWLSADGTTLGADNGIGLATALAFLDVSDIAHGPLEILATVAEETGLNGALGLDPAAVAGRMLFNLDSEEDGVFYVGCAGGRDAVISLPLDRVRPASSGKAFALSVKGLKGGHSGLDIIRNRGNAVTLLVRALALVAEQHRFSIARVTGGDKHNAIPREATALVVADGDAEGAWQPILCRAAALFLEEHGAEEPDIRLDMAPAEMPDSVLSDGSGMAVMYLLGAIPTGVTAMMRDMPWVVESSNNLARVTTEQAVMKILCSSRSAVNAGLEGVAARLQAVSGLAAAHCEEQSRYPGWQPDLGSKLLARAQAVWKEVHGGAPEIRVVHAGLECGIIGEKLEGVDMISIGPTIESPHSPSERVHIPSVERFFAFAKAFVASIAEG